MTTGKSNLKEVASLFFKLGCISFGGPAVHIAMMQDEIVKKRKWMSDAHFLDLISATNLIPGPNSTEMTMHCGYERAGWKGLFVAGLCFIIPAVIITAAFAWAYMQYGSLPQVQAFIYGIKPAVIALVVSALIALAKTAFSKTSSVILGLLTFIACMMGMNEIAALFACGFAGMALFFLRQKNKSTIHSFTPLILMSGKGMVTASTGKIFFIFLKVGALLYGSGYVLFSFLDAELVQQGLLSRQQLMDAIAVGQLTPGPLFSAATFVGWQMGGWQGALAATAGIFLPSFFFVAVITPLIPKMRKSAIAGAFLDAINAASVAVIAVVCIQMGRDAISDWKTSAIAIIALATTVLFKKINSAIVVIGGAVAGYLLQLL